MVRDDVFLNGINIIVITKYVQVPITKMVDSSSSDIPQVPPPVPIPNPVAPQPLSSPASFQPAEPIKPLSMINCAPQLVQQNIVPQVNVTSQVPDLQPQFDGHFVRNFPI